MKKGLAASWHRSPKSLVSLYARGITLLFALFCVASGLGMKTSAETIDGTVKSRALFASDSTPLSEIKLYLSMVAFPVYGMSAVPCIKKVDSTSSDKDGFFTFPDTVAKNHYAIIAELAEGGKPVTYMSREPYTPKPGDTLYTVYMSKLVFSGVKDVPGAAAPQTLHAIHGGNLVLRIPEWMNESKRVVVTNLRGETVARLQVSPNGEIRWNAESVDAGIYFLDIANAENHFTIKIALR